MKKLALLLLPTTCFALSYSYDFVILGEYYPPSYQHIVGPDKKYQPLVEEKPKPILKVKLSIPLFKKTINKPITTVYFDFDSYKVKETEKEKLKDVRGAVILKGYASPEGSEEYNYRLSEKRIDAVKNLLKNVSILKEEPLGETACKLNKSKWHLCRKVEIIKKGN